MHSFTVDAATLWLPLLKRLTERLPSWGLWKNADTALSGQGDFDSTAPVEDWSTITAEFRRWAFENGLGPVAICREVSGVLFLLAVDRERHVALELDVNARKYFRAWTMFTPADLRPVMEIDPRGFRRVRPGAEGIILLVQNGLRWGGRPDVEGLRRKEVRRFLASDPEGVRLASHLFGSADEALRAAAAAVIGGGWDRRAMLTLESWALARALTRPGVIAGRLAAPRRKRRCPLLHTIFIDDRRIDDVDAWVRAVERDHDVFHSP
ncbi:MAG: hypothetical protein H0W36_00745 [Gemmatimonadetes bacterium]|nr:hypothetical protein [Gemmatimonadota bacterium]